MSIYDIDIWSIHEEISNVSEGARKKGVVAVEIKYNVARDSCKAAIDCIGLAFVGFASPTNSFAEALQDPDGFVGRSPVLNVIKNSRIILFSNALRPIGRRR